MGLEQAKNLAEAVAKAKREAEKRRLEQEYANQQKKKKKRKKGRGQDDDEDGEADDDDMRSPSPGVDRGAKNASSSSLMTEEEVRAMVNKGKKSERGSARAQARIQKEREQWESAKASNPEFWKAPKFCLCYSAETGKKRSY